MRFEVGELVSYLNRPSDVFSVKDVDGRFVLVDWRWQLAAKFKLASLGQQEAPDAIPPTDKPAVSSSSVAGSILNEAASIVGGDRNSTHGDKERSFQVIANLWNAYLNGRKTQGDITPFDVAQFMVLLKVARSIQGKPVRDHFTDAAGYSAIAGELSA